MGQPLAALPSYFIIGLWFRVRDCCVLCPDPGFPRSSSSHDVTVISVEPVGYDGRRGRNFYVSPYGHTESGNHKEKNITRGVLSSYLQKIPCCYPGRCSCRTCIKVSSNKSSKYAKFRRVCSDGLDKATIQREVGLLPMRTRGVDWPTTGVRLLPVHK
jgi:hypothetical protein